MAQSYYRDSQGRARPITPPVHQRGHQARMPSSARAKGPLTSEQRKRLPDSDFAIPSERKYPINDPSHARNALARVSANGTPEEKRKVCEAVHERYPEIHAESCPMH